MPSPRQCPVSEPSRLALEEDFPLITDMFGRENTRLRKVLLPTPTDFPIRYDGSIQTAWDTMHIVAAQMEMHPEDIQPVYRDFMTRDPTPYYAAVLKENYNKVQSLRPGATAPDFTLKDEHGRQVSLSSLKGKVVYLDFWGVYCGPCMAEINDHTAQLHEKYKDKNVVFVNICVDASDAEWKNTLFKSQLKGVNLLTQFSDPICSTYNIAGIPHYFLIDQAGRIVDNNAPRPSQGNTLTDALDKLMK